MYRIERNVLTGETVKVPLSAEEIAQREAFTRDVAPGLEQQELRRERNRLLAETDWWVLPDRTATDEQLAYRQALRDLPANTADPANPVWPTKPGSEPVAEEPAAE